MCKLKKLKVLNTVNLTTLSHIIFMNPLEIENIISLLVTSWAKYNQGITTR